MEEFDEFEDDDDIYINAKLDVRFVIIGLSMMILGLTLPIFYFENIWLKYFCLLMFASSFFVMTKRDRKTDLS